MFYNSVALIAMSFVLERKEGLFERSYAAGKGSCKCKRYYNDLYLGASVTDFVFAYTLHGSLIITIQVISLMVTTFAIIGVRL